MFKLFDQPSRRLEGGGGFSTMQLSVLTISPVTNIHHCYIYFYTFYVNRHQKRRQIKLYIEQRRDAVEQALPSCYNHLVAAVPLTSHTQAGGICKRLCKYDFALVSQFLNDLSCFRATLKGQRDRLKESANQMRNPSISLLQRSVLYVCRAKIQNF